VSPGPDIPARAPRWSTLTCLVLAVLGLGAALYLSIEHANHGTSFACPETGTIDCLKVTTSSYSTMLGVPVAYAGLGYFIVMLVVVTAGLRGARGADRIQLVLSAVGLLAVFYLVWAELFRLHAICLWCTGVHVATFLIFAITLLGEALRMPGEAT
jgi:uncharacterized membrane protein